MLFTANLIHLSYNMWEEEEAPVDLVRKASGVLRFDEPLWEELTEKMAQSGFTSVVLDLGDGIAYRSHPEIAVKGAWTPDRLNCEVHRLRKMGLELLPKLNFSTGHDVWLKEYSRCVSTPQYYQVCADLIAEVCEIMERPRFFHLGMDEETAAHQRNYLYVVIRQHALFWHDLNWLAAQVERHGVRPWIWSDAIWNHEEAFLREVPKSILQSNWYYGDEFNPPHQYVEAYRTLDRHGYDQVPTCSNWANDTNTAHTLEWCRKEMDSERLFGFLTAPWKPTLPEWREHHLKAIEQMKAAL